MIKIQPCSFHHNQVRFSRATSALLGEGRAPPVLPLLSGPPGLLEPPRAMYELLSGGEAGSCSMALEGSGMLGGADSGDGIAGVEARLFTLRKGMRI